MVVVHLAVLCRGWNVLNNRELDYAVFGEVSMDFTTF